MGTVLLLIACKGLADPASLSSFRGGPVFPSIFIGAVAGVAASHLPGLPMVPAVAMGIRSMCCARLTLPLTSTLLLGADGVQVMPVVIVAVVVVAYVTNVRLAPPRAGAEPDGAAAGVPAEGEARHAAV